MTMEKPHGLAKQTLFRSSSTQQGAKLLLLSCMVLTVPACNTLPKQIPQTPVYAFDLPTDQTSLGKIVLPLREQNPGLTGFHVLYNPLEALAARIHLIDKAEKTLDLQYYIWDNDRIGSLALYSILKAADRGVKVRLLIDDNNAKKMEGIYLALDQHAKY